MVAPSLFTSVKNSTPCPYAKTAAISYAPAWDQESDHNWEAIAKSLVDWAAGAETRASHGFVIQVAESNAHDFDSVSRSLRTTLETLNQLDPAESRCLQEPIENTEWQFEFASLRLFVNLFATCYPPDHSKFIADPCHIYLFLQPEYSFDLCGVTRDNTRAKETIRQRFQRAGRPYSGELVDRRIEAYLYMFPLHIGDPPVKWWK